MNLWPSKRAMIINNEVSRVNFINVLFQTISIRSLQKVFFWLEPPSHPCGNSRSSLYFPLEFLASETPYPFRIYSELTWGYLEQGWRMVRLVFLVVMCVSPSQFLYEAVLESRFFGRLNVSKSRFVCLFFINDVFSSLDIEFQ